jgi:hypothetical protein
MNLNDAQRAKVAEWIAQGLKLSEIQNRLGTELGLNLTYMDVRFLVDDLKLTPKDVERPKAAPVLPANAGTKGKAAAPSAGPPPQPASATGKLSIGVDQIARPGAVVSGNVTFTDGNAADWYFDQTGRLGLVPHVQGYRPSASDLQQFQAALDSELSKMGF